MAQEQKEQPQQGLNEEDTLLVMQKLQTLRTRIQEDQETIEKQKKEIKEKDEALMRVHTDLQNIRKELLITGGEATEQDFREMAGKYLHSIRNELEFLKQHRYGRTLIKKPLRVLVTGAAGRVSYALLPMLATGQAFGVDQPLILTLLEITPAMKALQGVAMEIEDCAYPLVEQVIATDDHAVAFHDIDYAILVGGYSKFNSLRNELLEKNCQIFKGMGEALEKHAKATCKVLVVANPSNTTCLVCSKYAPKIPKKNFAALTRLDQNRGITQLALKLGVPIGAVSNIVVWGNHSNTQVPDLSHALVTVDGKKKKAEVEEKWVQEEFIPCVQKRAKKVLDMNGFTSASSAANATKDCLRDWHFGTPEGEYVALGVYSDGSYYNVAKDIIYSFPVICKDGDFSVVPNLEINEHIKAMMKKTEEELLDERKEAGIKD